MSFNFTGLQNKEKGERGHCPCVKDRKKGTGKNGANLAVISLERKTNMAQIMRFCKVSVALL